MLKFYQNFSFTAASPSSSSGFLNVIYTKFLDIRIGLHCFQKKKKVISNRNVGINIFSFTENWSHKNYIRLPHVSPSWKPSLNELQLFLMHSRKQSGPNSPCKFFSRIDKANQLLPAIFCIRTLFQNWDRETNLYLQCDFIIFIHNFRSKIHYFLNEYFY